MKAFGYLRVSGKGQVDGDGFPRQEGAIRDYATSRGIEIVEWFHEKAVKGATEWEARPAWVDMLDHILNNGVRSIIIEKLDRLARELMVQEHIIADLKRRGIELVSVHEPDLGSNDPTRVMFRQIMGAISQYEKTMIVLKLRGARERKRNRDGKCEGARKYGEWPGEAEVRARIISLADGGTSCAEISRCLNAEGVLPRRGYKWHPWTVQRVVESCLLRSADRSSGSGSRSGTPGSE